MHMCTFSRKIGKRRLGIHDFWEGYDIAKWVKNVMIRQYKTLNPNARKPTRDEIFCREESLTGISLIGIDNTVLVSVKELDVLLKDGNVLFGVV